MKFMRSYLIVCLILTIFGHVKGLTLKASQLSLIRPTIVNETSTIILDTTIIIDKPCELIKASPLFNRSNAIITFTTQIYIFGRPWVFGTGN